MPYPYVTALAAIRADRAELVADLDLIELALQHAHGRPDERELLEAAATLEHATLGDCDVLGALIEARFPGDPGPDADPGVDEARRVLRELRQQSVEQSRKLRRDTGARGPWFITARAVREYLELTGRESTEETFPDGEDELLEIAADESRRHLVRRQNNGQDLYRLSGTPRLRLLVAPGPRPEGPLPQLVRVLPEHASQAKRR